MGMNKQFRKKLVDFKNWLFLSLPILNFFWMEIKRPIRFFTKKSLKHDRTLQTMIHYLKNKVGVVDFANAQGLVMFQSPRALRDIGL